MNALMSLTLAAAVSLAVMSPASAKDKRFTANLTGASEVPPTGSAAKAKAKVNYNAANRKLKWTVTYSDLSGPLTAAHFHGPAGEGENAPPMVTIEPLDAKLQGTAELTEDQEKALNDGKMYINLHTAKFPNGEIRGQVKSN